MNFSSRAFFTLLVLLFIVNPFYAQETSEKESVLCTPELSRSLVEQQIDDSKTVEDSDKRIKILLRVAEFIWQLDETRSRKHFSDALDLARERFKEKGVEEKGNGRFIERQDDYRFRVLTAIAQKDSAWADKLTDTVLEEMKTAREEAPDRKRNWSDNETSRLLDIAGALMKPNKTAAFQFARRAAQFPLDDNAGRWFSFLYHASGADQREADALYSELLRNASANAKIQAMYSLSGYPFGYHTSYGLNNSVSSMTVPAGFVPNPALQRQFLDVLTRKTLALKPPTEASKGKWDFSEAMIAFSIMQDLEPIVTERFQDLLPRLSAAKAHANSLLTAENLSTLGEKRKGDENARASFDKKLEALEKKADSKNLDTEIINLVFAAKTDDELGKAGEWLIKIGDEKVRESTTNYLYFKRAEVAVKESRLADAEKHSDKVSELEHRAILLFKIAEARLKQENTKESAAEVLETTVKAALKAPNGVERAQVLLGSAFWFEKYNQYRAADVLSEAVKTINRLENPDLSASYIHRKIEGKDYGYYTSIETPGYNIEKSFAQVAQKDLVGALNQARSLDDKFIRTIAVIAVVGNCAGASEKQKKPAPKNKQNKSN